jgi:hypothetical protein
MDSEADSKTPDTKPISADSPEHDSLMVATAVSDPKDEPKHDKDHDKDKEKQDEEVEEQQTPMGGANASRRSSDSPGTTLARHIARVEAIEEAQADIEAQMVKMEGGALKGVRALKIVEKVREEMMQSEGQRDEEAHELQVLKIKCDRQEKTLVEMDDRLRRLESDKRDKTPGRRTPRTGGRARDSSTGDGEHEDEEEWDKMSTHSTSPDATASLGIAFFTNSEIDTFVCDMTRAEVIDKMPELREDLMARHPAIGELLEMADDEYENALDMVGEEGAEFRAADVFIRRACRAVVKGKTNEIKVWKSQERALRISEPTKARQGRRMLERMEAFGALVSPDDVREHKKHLTTNMDYLTVGMKKMQARAGAERLREDWALLPSKDRAAIDLLRLLCSKVPAEMEEDKSRTLGERLEDEIDEAERRGRKVDSYEQLSEVIAGRIAKTTRPAAMVVTKNGKERCHNCDKYDCDGWAECPVRCKAVSWLKGCPCCRGEECVVEKETLPPRDEIKGKRKSDGKGREIVRLSTYEHMKKAHAELGEKKAGEARGADGETPDDAKRAAVGAVVTTTSPLVF